MIFVYVVCRLFCDCVANYTDEVLKTEWEPILIQYQVSLRGHTTSLAKVFQKIKQQINWCVCPEEGWTHKVQLLASQQNVASNQPGQSTWALAELNCFIARVALQTWFSIPMQNYTFLKRLINDSKLPRSFRLQTNFGN